MSGTKSGGKAASKTIKQLYGDSFYKRIGAKGGKNGSTGGFHVTKGYPITHPAHPSNAGRKGGIISRKGAKNG